MRIPKHFTLESHWIQIAAAIAAITVLWAILTWFALPWLVESIYRQKSLPSLNSLLWGPTLNPLPLEHYLAQWNRIALVLLPILLLTVLIPLCPSGRYEIPLLIALLAATAAVRLPGLLSRATWDDEGITLLEVAGNPMPSWPREPTRAGEVQKLYRAEAPLSKITAELRLTDIHPPVYYWGLHFWRRRLGDSIESARLFSLACSVGTVVALYLLLRAGGIKWPLVPAMVYAFSTCAVFFGSIARSYALASLIITLAALFAYLATKASPGNKLRAVTCAVSMSVCCGLAFQTHYFSLFPVCIILGWFCINLWPKFRTMTIIFPLLSMFLGMIGLSTLFQQLGARNTQYAGFPRWVVEIKALLRADLGVLWDPMYNNRVLDFMAVAGVPVLIGITLYQIWIHRRDTNRKLWALLLGLAVAPSLGLLLMDVLFKRHLTYSMYLLFGGPALAVILVYPITRLRSSWLRLGTFLLVIMFEMDGINWGFEEGPVVREVSIRSLAILTKASASPSQIVVIDEGYGRSNPASAVYELDPKTLMVCFGRGSDPEKLWSMVRDYHDVWIVRSFDDETETMAIRKELDKRFQESPSFKKDFENHSVTRFLRAAGAVPENTELKEN